MHLGAKLEYYSCLPENYCANGSAGLEEVGEEDTMSVVTCDAIELLKQLTKGSNLIVMTQV